MTKMIEMDHDTFQRAIRLAYKRGCVRVPSTYITEEEEQEVIRDMYELLELPDEKGGGDEDTKNKK